MLNFMYDEDAKLREARMRNQRRLQQIVDLEKKKSNNGSYLNAAYSQMGETTDNEREFQLVYKMLLSFCVQEDQLYTETGLEY